MKKIGTVNSLLKDWGLEEIVLAGVLKYAKAHTVRAGILNKAQEEINLYDVVENGRTKTRAGLTKYRQRVIELHSVLLVPGKEQDRNQTFLHEVAHILEKAICGTFGHGQNWKRLMESMGLVPEVYQKLPEMQELYVRASYVYVCKKCGYVYHRSRRIKDVENHCHRACKGGWEFLGRASDIQVSRGMYSLKSSRI